MNKKPTFLSYAEAVATARRDPEATFVGLAFNPATAFLTVYTLQADEDDADTLNIEYEGGELFDLGGEEDFFDETSVPAEAKQLLYASKAELGDGKPHIAGMTAEYVLSTIVPGLNAPDMYRSEEEFAEMAGKAFKAFWSKG